MTGFFHAGALLVLAATVLADCLFAARAFMPVVSISALASWMDDASDIYRGFRPS